METIKHKVILINVLWLAIIILIMTIITLYNYILILTEIKLIN